MQDQQAARVEPDGQSEQAEALEQAVPTEPGGALGQYEPDAKAVQHVAGQAGEVEPVVQSGSGGAAAEAVPPGQDERAGLPL